MMGIVQSKINASSNFEKYGVRHSPRVSSRVAGSVHFGMTINVSIFQSAGQVSFLRMLLKMIDRGRDNSREKSLISDGGMSPKTLLFGVLVELIFLMMSSGVSVGKIKQDASSVSGPMLRQESVSSAVYSFDIREKNSVTIFATISGVSPLYRSITDHTRACSLDVKFLMAL